MAYGLLFEPYPQAGALDGNKGRRCQFRAMLIQNQYTPFPVGMSQDSLVARIAVPVAGPDDIMPSLSQRRADQCPSDARIQQDFHTAVKLRGSMRSWATILWA